MAEQTVQVWEPDQQEMDIYRRHYAPANTTDEEWEIFLETCRAYRVSPIRRQIYLVGRYDSVKKRMVNTPQISIGTLRLLALRTKEFEGTTEPEWGDEEGNWYKLWPKHLGPHPYAARIGIYRRGFRSPVWGIVYFHERAQKKSEQNGGGLTKFWNDQGINMITKCAEADGLRKAFEEECGGIYLHEEMNQADADSSVVTIIPEVDTSDPETNEALKETASKSQALQMQSQVNLPEEKQSSIPSVKDLQKRCAKIYGVGYWQTVVHKALKLAESETLLDKDITPEQRIKILKYLDYVEDKASAGAGR